MKKISIIGCIVFFSSISFCRAEVGYMERTYYSGPMNDIVIQQSGWLYDGAAYYIVCLDIYVAYAADIRVYCEYFFQNGLTIRDIPPIAATINGQNWIENYYWRGDPCDFNWVWRISSDHEVLARANSATFVSDYAYARVKVDGSVIVPNNRQDLSMQVSYAEVNNGSAGLLLTWPPGIVYNPTPGTQVQNSGIIGVKQATSVTSVVNNSGPYQRSGLINYAEAVVDLNYKTGLLTTFPKGIAVINIYFHAY
ncbi:MAG: hypothetical protein AB1656_11650 [Candidatus Omnitrophota bacterium]